MSSADRDIDGKLKQRFGKIEPHVGSWKPEKPKGPIIGCLLPILPILVLIGIILGVLLWA